MQTPRGQHAILRMEAWRNKHEIEAYTWREKVEGVSMGFFSETKAALEIGEKAKTKFKRGRREKLEFRAPYCWAKNDPTPFCPTCYEGEKVAIHLFGPTHYANGMARECKRCKTQYQETHESQIFVATGTAIFAGLLDEKF